MVDTCATVTQRSWVDIEVTRQLFRRSLHRMAQPDLFDMRIAGIHRPGIHRHWVNIVEHGGIGAHNTARPQRIGNGLFQTMPLTDLEISHRARFITANLKCHHDKIGIL